MKDSLSGGISLRQGFLVAQLIKNLPALWETWVPSLVWEDPLEKGMATLSSILAWRISRGLQRDTTEQLNIAQPDKIDFKSEKEDKTS